MRGLVNGRRRSRAALGAGLVALVALVAACGVEVPDEVADDLRGTTTTTEVPATTETPQSEDELEQALIDNGYSEEEAACGAQNLREALDEEQIASIVEAETIEDISPSTGRAFARALAPCVEGGGRPGFEGPNPPDEDDDGPDPGAGRPVSRSQFLSGLISGGVPEDQARCIVAGVYRQLAPDEISALFHADSDADVPDDVLDTFEAISDSCE